MEEKLHLLLQKFKLKLSNTLQKIKENDLNYEIRYELIIKAMYYATEIGYETGLRCDKDNNWPIAIIHLPEGQVSWHMEPDPIEYDGHSTEEKYIRIDDYTKTVLTQI